MATSALLPNTTFGAAVSRHASSLKDFVRRAFMRRPRTIQYMRNLGKNVFSRNPSTSKCLEQTVAFVIDEAINGSLEEAKSIGEQLIAIAISEHAAAHPELRNVQFSVEEAHLLEEHAEGLVEEAETAMAHNPTLANRMKYLAAAADHECKRRVLNAAVRREVARTA